MERPSDRAGGGARPGHHGSVVERGVSRGNHPFGAGKESLSLALRCCSSCAGGPGARCGPGGGPRAPLLGSLATGGKGGGPPGAAVAGGKEWPALEAALAALEKEGEIVRTEHGLRWGEAQGGLEGEDAERAEEVWERFRQAGVEVPTVAVVAAELGITEAAATRLVQVLQRQGRMVKVGGSLYYSAEGLQELIARISEEIAARGEITLAEVRDLFGTSRKYAQALVEHMDSEGLTLRVGDARRLRKKRKQGK